MVLAVRLGVVQVAINLEHFATHALCASDQPARHFLDFVGRQLLQLEFMQVNRGDEGVQLVEVNSAWMPCAVGTASRKVGFACCLGAVEMFGQAMDDAPAFYLLGHLDSAVHDGGVHLGGCAGADLFEAFAHGVDGAGAGGRLSLHHGTYGGGAGLLCWHGLGTHLLAGDSCLAAGHAVPLSPA